MTVVDTTVWIDYFRGIRNPQTDWLNQQAGSQPLALTDLILCEVLQGVRAEREFRLIRASLTPYFVLHTGGEPLAVAAAQNYRFLGRMGFTIRKLADCLIATYCIEEGHSLLHQDRDFDPFERHLGLQVIHA